MPVICGFTASGGGGIALTFCCSACGGALESFVIRAEAKEQTGEIGVISSLLQRDSELPRVIEA